MLTEQQERYITSRGEHLEELIAEGNPLIIIGIINRGLGTEYYEEWKTHKHDAIRQPWHKMVIILTFLLRMMTPMSEKRLYWLIPNIVSSYWHGIV